jgi:thiamine kinase-like enzyme
MADLGEIVGLLEHELGPASGPPEPLEGGITNRNFRVRFGERDCVLRLTASSTGLLGIDRSSELKAGQMAASLGVGPPVLACGEGFLVTAYLACTPVRSADLAAAPDPAARALRAFHESGLELANRFWVPDLLEQYERVVVDHGQTPPPAYAAARSVADRIAVALPLSEPVPCHDDLLAANLLRTPTTTMLVDWEYAGMGHRMFDLGNLAVNNDFDEPAEDRLLSAYFGEPPTAGRRAALALMRILSDAREAAWGVVQTVISDLDFDFGAYARQHFERLERAAATPRLEALLDAAAP